MGSLLASPVREHDQPGGRGARGPVLAEATGDFTAFERMQVQLATRSLSDDDPPGWSQFWFGSHPTTLQRLGLARALEQRER